MSSREVRLARLEALYRPRPAQVVFVPRGLEEGVPFPERRAFFLDAAAHHARLHKLPPLALVIALPAKAQSVGEWAGLVAREQPLYERHCKDMALRACASRAEPEPPT